jgi:uncharacterized protein YqeY
MSLAEKIKDDLKNAMKAGQEFEAGVFRMLLSAFHNKEIEKKGKRAEPELSDDEIIEILSKEGKKRKEAAEIYNKGNRRDLAEKEVKELELIKKYLPEEMPAEEIEKIVKGAIERLGIKDIKDSEGKPSASYGASFGKVMAEAMKELKGKADAGAVSEIAKRILGL